MAVAALFSTASANNATLYGGANVSASLAERGGLPSIFRKRLWMGTSGSLIVTGAQVAAIGASVDIARIAMAGSAAFLVVYGGVNLAHLRLREETGAPRASLLVAVLGCLAVFAVLVRHLFVHERRALLGLVLLLALSLGFEWFWRKVLARKIQRREGAAESH